MADTVPQEFLAPRRLQDKYTYPPSFIRLLQTNDPPPDDLDATRTIPDMMARAADDIALAEKEIKSLRAQIREKKADIWALGRVIDDCNTVLSPIRKLPTDIILEIFRAVVQERYDVFEITRGPWILTHIYKTWRTLACTYGALWSSANITNVTSRGKTFSLQNPAMLLQTALKRSGTFPLSVWFDYKTKKRQAAYRYSEINLPPMVSNSGELSASTEDDEEGVLSNGSSSTCGVIGKSFAKLSIECQLVTVLIRHSRRLKHLNINVSTPPALKCLRALNGRLDRLETLHISLRWGGRIPNELQESFSMAPMLHSVRLNELSLASTLHLPLSQLRFLDHQLQNIRSDVWRTTVQTILLQGSHLTDYGPPSPQAPYNSEMPRIDNPLIRTFRVRDWYVLDYFRLPGIDELHIRHFGWVDGQIAGDTLSAFIYRSRCTLRKLHLRGVPDSILSALPSVHKCLVELEITVTTSNTKLLSGLTAFMCEPGHFPRLSRLEIKVSNEICLFHESLSEYLKQIYALVDDLWNARTKVRLEVWFSISDFSHAHRVCNVRKFRRLRNKGSDIAVFATRKSKHWRLTVGHGEEEDVEDLRDVLLDEDGQDDGSDWEDDDFEEDDDLGEESEEC
ncbi:hypothetical protein EV421DRAFT_1906877 [Armillaria borealis]|uniref:F-box domain-containing protein n=1 Tax=Armillaria borealis TaxID=47425 RepID=A0AA39MLF4_9AGAR|nr:hypothetical protein EV421DRAFT_1906877 [Armillaria borealis]